MGNLATEFMLPYFKLKLPWLHIKQKMNKNV